MSVALSYGNNIICFGNVAISAGVVEPQRSTSNDRNLNDTSESSAQHADTK